MHVPLQLYVINCYKICWGGTSAVASEDKQGKRIKFASTWMAMI